MKYCFSILLAVFGFLFSPSISAQIDEHGPVVKNKKEQKDRPSFKERLVYGGNVGAFFGTATFVNINPMVGYKITEPWAAGIGINYLYYNTPAFRGSLFGKSVWTRHYFLEQFYAHAEFESIRYGQTGYRELDKRNVNVALIGLGYQSNYFGIAVLYDLIQDPYSPYSTPLFRIGGMMGIGN
ncbi:MAG: hypothetical protein RLZZ262_2562 [Bacteroidota bacterium]|jgi:hypothetical protein